MATKPRVVGPGGGAKGLSVRATKKITFFAASLTVKKETHGYLFRKLVFIIFYQ